MRYIDVYPGCERCPVEKYCGTMIGSIRLCNSYNKENERRNRLALNNESLH